jgi:hypothetical protein
MSPRNFQAQLFDLADDDEWPNMATYLFDLSGSRALVVTGSP